jgi:hypothetical protein
MEEEKEKGENDSPLICNSNRSSMRIPFYIPAWLMTTRWCDTDGSPSLPSTVLNRDPTLIRRIFDMSLPGW